MDSLDEDLPSLLRGIRLQRVRPNKLSEALASKPLNDKLRQKLLYCLEPNDQGNVPDVHLSGVGNEFVKSLSWILNLHPVGIVNSAQLS